MADWVQVNTQGALTSNAFHIRLGVYIELLSYRSDDGWLSLQSQWKKFNYLHAFILHLNSNLMWPQKCVGRAKISKQEAIRSWNMSMRMPNLKMVNYWVFKRSFVAIIQPTYIYYILFYLIAQNLLPPSSLNHLRQCTAVLHLQLSVLRLFSFPPVLP